MRWITLAAASVLAAGPTWAGVQAGRILGKVSICGAGGCGALYEGRPLDAADVITTARGSRCDLDADGGSLRALEGSRVRLDDPSARSCSFTLLSGSALAAWPEGDCVVATPQAEAGGAGARFRVALDDGLARISVLERAVRVSAKARPDGMRRRWWAGKVPAVAKVPGNAAASIVILKGSARAVTGEAEQTARLGMPLLRGDELRTGGGWAALAFADGSMTVLDSQSRLVIEPRGTGFAISLRRGRLYVLRRGVPPGERAAVVAGGSSADGDSDEFEASAPDGSLAEFIVYSGTLSLTADGVARGNQASR